ncbi:hypothetical protein [Paraburkholderia acidisoli]|uniref:Uncharacterized protein n=1 Tax=Paraburkholderia acidisoli TaxID=2571748 RepID=A0A7Z2GM20_9BURK|nr:hypothetical protein [Paraburkholderia acidisoli]QGZ64302.1 hypothetical protein FAZ98_21510 [Paraburkholderia acidisoli]
MPAPKTHAHALSVALTPPAPPPVPRRSSATVLPFRAPRQWLDLALEGRTLRDTRSHLALLPRSPPGVYVTGTHERGESIRVRLDIAPEDFGFTLPRLMSTVPAATINAPQPRSP